MNSTNLCTDFTLSALAPLPHCGHHHYSMLNTEPRPLSVRAYFILQCPTGQATRLLDNLLQLFGNPFPSPVLPTPTRLSRGACTISISLRIARGHIPGTKAAGIPREIVGETRNVKRDHPLHPSHAEQPLSPCFFDVPGPSSFFALSSSVCYPFRRVHPLQKVASDHGDGGVPAGISGAIEAKLRRGNAVTRHSLESIFFSARGP